MTECLMLDLFFELQGTTFIYFSTCLNISLTRVLHELAFENNIYNIYLKN